MNNSEFRPRGAARASVQTLACTLFFVWALFFRVVLPAKAALDHVPGRVLVQFQPTVSAQQMRSLIASANATDKGEIPHTGVHILNLPAGSSEVAVADAFAKRPEVSFADLDVIVKPAQTTVTPNDPYYANAEWHLKQIKCQYAWPITTGSSGITIAIIDTGVDGSHPDLAKKMVPGWNFYDNNSDASDAGNHGTCVAGVAAADSNNGIGVASIAWGSKIMPLRVAAPDGTASMSSIASAITWAMDHGARVANCSYCAISNNPTLDAAAKVFQANGGIVTVAAGNSSLQMTSPLDPYVINVGSSDSQDKLSAYSNFGSNLDVLAPYCAWTTIDGGYNTIAGTSISAPIVAGVAALVISANPNLTGQQVKSIIELSCDDVYTKGWDIYSGYGRVNAANAITLAMGGGSADTTAPTVSITSPGNGSNVSGSVSIQATASDNVGVTSVVISVDGTAVSTLTLAPFIYTWDTSTAGNGSHTIKAIASDAAGNSSSSQISVSVNNPDTTPPTASITSPSGGATVSGSVSVQVAASDNVGVASVTLYVDGTSIAADATAPYSFSWDSTTSVNGTHTLTVVAADAAGNSTSCQVSVTVSNSTADTSPPTITITSPASGTSIGRTLTVTINAADNVGVTKVELYVDGSLKASSTSAPFTTSVNTRKWTSGGHTIYCKAYDAAGNSSTSPTVLVYK